MKKQKKRNHSNKFKNFVFIFLGTISLFLGILGIFLPLLPTTPFLLLTAYLYAKSSQKLYSWLISNKYFGKYIDRYRQGLGVPKRSKIIAVLTLWLTIISSIIYFIHVIAVSIILLLIAGAVTYHIISLPTFIEKRKI